MDNNTWNDLEVASEEIVMQSAKQFAEALANTPQYKTFEQAYFTYRQDAGVQAAIEEFQKKQSSLKALLILNAVSEKDREELQILQEQFYHQLSVVQYTEAQEDLAKVCQEIGDLLSKTIGVDFGAACKTGGCCG